MKQLFFRILFIVLVCLVFVYLLIDCVPNSKGKMEGILVATASDGLSPIGFILLVPTFVFTIITLTVKRNNLDFVRCTLGMFASGFALVSTILFLVDKGKVEGLRLAIPIAVIIFSAAILIIAICDVIGVIQEDKKEKEKKAKEEALDNSQNNQE